jgi:hypothetical protein
MQSSTIHLFKNPKLLKNIHEDHRQDTMASNGVTARTNWKGMFPGFGDAWYDPQAITNILSLKAVQEKYQIQYDRKMGNTFVVDMGSNSMMKFYQSPEGLYYYDTANTKNEMSCSWTQ